MDRFDEIKKRIITLANNDDSLHAVIAIGSSVRSYSAADEYSDLDLIICTEQPEEWLYGGKPEMLGEIKISFVEPTLGGGFERRVLFTGSLDADLIILTPPQLETAVRNGVAEEVMNRGYNVMYDDMGIGALINEHVSSSVRVVSMQENEFCNKVNDFWFHTVWAAKKILRGELWTAKMCIDAYLKSILLNITEFNRSLSGAADVWHCGRFFEKWAGEKTTDALKKCFAHYDKNDMISALHCTAELFSAHAGHAAEISGYPYPHEAEEYALTLLNEYIPKQDKAQ